MLSKYQSRSALILLATTVLAACVSNQDIILPTKHERISLVDVYKRCVANATNSRFDKFTNPDVIVRSAMKKCIRSKNAMLRDYPQSWRRGLESDVDEVLYRREVAWIKETRIKKEK